MTAPAPEPDDVPEAVRDFLGMTADAVWEATTPKSRDAEIAAVGARLAAEMGVTGLGDRYFEPPKMKLLMGIVLEDLQIMGPIRRGDLGLYVYQDGWWQFDQGNAIIGRRLLRMLGHRWNSGHQSNVVAALMNMPVTIGVEPEQRFLNVKNGLLDWRQPAGPLLLPHSPDVLSMYQIPTAWVLDAACPAIDGFLTGVLPPDSLAFFYRVLGYTLQGDNPKHIAVMLSGVGGNGKGTAQRIHIRMVGDRNVANISPQLLDRDRFSAAELHGRLCWVAGDVDARMFESTETFKRASGEDVLTAQKKYGQLFGMKVTATLVAAFNKQPTSADLSRGWFRRWMVIPFDRVITEGEEIGGLDAKLATEAELQGLLVREVEGLRDWYFRDTFDPPKAIVRAKDRYRRDIDSVASWLEEITVVVDPAQTVRSKQVFDMHREWCRENGHAEMSIQSFRTRFQSACVEKLGVMPEYTRGWVWTDIRHPDQGTERARVFKGIWVSSDSPIEEDE